MESMMEQAGPKDHTDMMMSNEEENIVSVSEKALFKINNTYLCPHVDLGCNLTFETVQDRYVHSKKTCIYSLTRWCMDKICLKFDKGQERNLNDLVDHATSYHECNMTIGRTHEEHFVLIHLSADFLELTNSDFSAKLCCTYKLDKEGSPFQIVFIAVMKKDDEGKKMLHIIPMAYGETGKCNYFMRVKMGLVNQNGKAIKCTGKLRHPSHKIMGSHEVFYAAIRSTEELFNAINENRTVTYVLEDLGWNEESKNDDQRQPLQIGLRFNVDAYRFHIWEWKEIQNPPPFLLTWAELDLCDAAKDLLSIGGVEEMLNPISSIFMPLLKAEFNMTVTSNDMICVIQQVMALMLTEKFAEPTYMECRSNSSKTMLIVLLPARFMVASLGVRIMERAKSVGITVSMAWRIQEAFDGLVKDGCELLITTPSVLMYMLRKDLARGGSVLFPKLKYVVVANADYLHYNNMANQMQTCMRIILENTPQQKILRIALAPFLSESTTIYLQSCLVGSNFRAIAMGPSPIYQISSMGLRQVNPVTFHEKQEAIFELVRKEDESSRILIVGDEGKATYKTDFGQLMLSLHGAFPTRHIFRCDEESTIEAVAFDAFKANAGSIMLSSYFCFHFGKGDKTSIKSCDSIIVYDKITANEFLIRLVPVVQKCDGTMKNCHVL